MIKIYEIAVERLQQVKSLLEAQDVVSGELDVERQKLFAEEGNRSISFQ